MYAPEGEYRTIRRTTPLVPMQELAAFNLPNAGIT